MILKVRILQVLALLSSAIFEALEGVGTAIVGSFSRWLPLLVFEIKVRIARTLHVIRFLLSCLLKRSLLVGSSKTLTSSVAGSSGQEFALGHLLGTFLSNRCLLLMLLLEPLIEGRLGGRVLNRSTRIIHFDGRGWFNRADIARGSLLTKTVSLRVEIISVIPVLLFARRIVALDATTWNLSHSGVLAQELFLRQCRVTLLRFRWRLRLRLRNDASTALSLCHLFLEQLLKRLRCFGFDRHLIDGIVGLSLRVRVHLLFLAVTLLIAVSQDLLIKKIVLSIIFVLWALLVRLMRVTVLIVRTLVLIVTRTTDHLAILEGCRRGAIARL